MTKYVLIIQCDIAHNRCSGFACTNSFYERAGAFEDYEENVKYISFTCGGCCGKSVAAKLEHFTRKLTAKTDILKNEVTVHLASCMVTDNYHYDKCPHVDFIKNILVKKGFENVIDGSYISGGASKKRKLGIYKEYNSGCVE